MSNSVGNPTPSTSAVSSISAAPVTTSPKSKSRTSSPSRTNNSINSPKAKTKNTNQIKSANATKEVYISRVGFRSDTQPSTGQTWFLILLVLVIVVSLLYLEYADHDCMRGKKCLHKRPDISNDDTREEAVNKVINMVRSNNNFVIWRQALIVAVIIPIPLIYLLYSRFPTLLEWLFVTLIIFMAMYLALSWLWAHYFNPNAQTIEANLEKLLDVSDKNDHV